MAQCLPLKAPWVVYSKSAKMHMPRS